MDLSLYTIFSFSIILIFSIILSVQDIKKMTVSIYIQWASIFTALACHMIFNREGMWIYILSGMICGTFYFAVRKITKDKLGPADVWFGFFQGLFLNLQIIPFCFIIEDVIALIVINKKFGKKPFPFIPFMSIGLVACFIIQSIN
jgi:prepilin signal peptidase PulO-like enzyme (type II secretory pathway)